MRVRTRPAAAAAAAVPGDVSVGDSYPEDAGTVVDDVDVSSVATDGHVGGVTQSRHVDVTVGETSE